LKFFSILITSFEKYQRVLIITDKYWQVLMIFDRKLKLQGANSRPKMLLGCAAGKLGQWASAPVQQRRACGAGLLRGVWLVVLVQQMGE